MPILICFFRTEVDATLSLTFPDKASGPDGFNVAFFKEYWHTVEDDVLKVVLDILNNGTPLNFINVTNIVHIQLQKIDRICHRYIFIRKTSTK